MIGRALLAFLALPGVVAFLVPLWWAWPAARARGFAWSALLLLLPGIGLLLWCVREFWVRGKGTLAPWDPPRHLVASGLYRISRNPMYVSVVLILIGWAIGFRSHSLLVYALAVMAAFHARVLLYEEPVLARTHRDEWKRYAARVPRWLFRSRRAVLGTWVAVLVALPLGGLIYEAYADGIAGLEFTPPGMLVDIGGRRLHLVCLGSGEPTVMFESPGFGNALSFSQARERIASRATVCSYDRSGMGWSDPANGPVSTGDLVRDLAVLQDRARLRGPFILVASSIGGLTAELFARLFPERTAGAVFLDAANSLTLARRESASGWIRPAACATGILAHFGLIRLTDPFGFYEEGTEQARRSAAVTYNSKVWMQLCAMARGLPDTRRDFAAAPPLQPDLPLAVLTAANTDDSLPPRIERLMGAQRIERLLDVEKLRAEIRTSHEEFAKLSTKGKWQTVPDSTHLIANSQPDAVADAVFEILEQVR
jgi:protein-S-isoprenylcysteine O-methyltransferase Ste14/pimeloyl-ACP methyl ester carboxylesterase